MPSCIHRRFSDALDAGSLFSGPYRKRSCNSVGHVCLDSRWGGISYQWCDFPPIAPLMDQSTPKTQECIGDWYICRLRSLATAMPRYIYTTMGSLTFVEETIALFLRQDETSGFPWDPWLPRKSPSRGMPCPSEEWKVHSPQQWSVFALRAISSHIRL